MNKDWGFKINTPFYVVSQLPDGRFLDLVGNNMLIKTRNGLPSQEWYFDQKTRTIRSQRTKSYAWTIQGNGNSANIAASGSNSEWYQLFKWDAASGSFTNVKNKKVLDVAGGRDAEATNVQVWKKNGSPAQKWKLVYTTDLKIQTKGLNKEFGLEIERPFFIVSKMWMNRVVECVGASNLVMKTLRTTNKGQQFYLDDKTQTIQSFQWKDRSITIQSNGRSNNLYMTTTNARWFQLFRW